MGVSQIHFHPQEAVFLHTINIECSITILYFTRRVQYWKRTGVCFKAPLAVPIQKFKPQKGTRAPLSLLKGSTPGGYRRVQTKSSTQSISSLELSLNWNIHWSTEVLLQDQSIHVIYTLINVLDTDVTRLFPTYDLTIIQSLLKHGFL